MIINKHLKPYIAEVNNKNLTKIKRYSTRASDVMWFYMN